MANIYLIRHCESEGNACRRTQAQSDALVTAKGYLQNEMLRRRFSDISIQGIYSSDAFRSIMTVEPIAKERGLPIRVRIHLREVTTGIWEDMAWGNIARDYAEDHKNWEEHHWDNTTPGASSFRQAADRLVFALRRIACEVGDGNALCVSHSCTIKAGLCAMLGRPLSDIKVIGHGENTCVTLIHVDGEGNFSVEYKNDASHLPPHLCRAWNGVAGDDVNMTVDPVDLEKEGPFVLELARAEHCQRRGEDVPFDGQMWLSTRAKELRRHPDYLAVCRLKGRITGFVHMRREADTPTDCGHVQTMYVIPELQGKGYAEQLFGYAAHVFRYEGMRTISICDPELSEDRRIAQRFLFVPMKGHEARMALELFSPPCPYPILA